MAFKTILAAIDGGEQTRKVLDLAVSLTGEAPDAVIHLLCVVDILPATAAGMAGATDLAIDTLETLAQQTVKDAAELLQGRSIRTEVHVLPGNSAQTIVAQAKTLNCDAIVVGHRHRTFWLRLFDQSTCVDLLDSAPCPLMIAN